MIPPGLRAVWDAPPRAFSPAPIWWWSGEPLDRRRLRWQLARFAAGGVHNLVILNLAPSGPMFGSDADSPPFFSDDWWALLDGVCEDAASLGVSLWFYDQLGFSGADLQARLVRDEPAYAGHWLEPGGTVSRRGFDYLSQAACADLLDRVHGEFERRLGHRLGNVIVGSFQDELASLPTWTEGFEGEFLRRRGYELGPSLWESGPESHRVRRDYHLTRAELAEEAFFRPLADWHSRWGLLHGCDQQDPARAGHPVGGVRLYADYARTHRWFGAPGSDHHGDARIHSSLAHLYGRQRTWIEAFHSSGWGGTLEETFDWLLPWLRSGATLYNPHAVYYTTKAGWWEWAPPSTDWRQPYWRHHRVFADAVTRLCAALSQGRHVCDVAVLLPTATAQAGSGPTSVEPFATLAQDTYRDLVGDMAWFRTIPGVLDRLGIDADVIDDDSVQRAVVSPPNPHLAQPTATPPTPPGIAEGKSEADPAQHAELPPSHPQVIRDALHSGFVQHAEASSAELRIAGAESEGDSARRAAASPAGPRIAEGASEAGPAQRADTLPSHPQVAVDAIQGGSAQRAEGASAELRIAGGESDRDLVPSGVGVSGRLLIAEEAYSTVLLPACTVLEGETARRLAELARAGGRVIAIGTPPRHGVGDPEADAAVADLLPLLDVVSSTAELGPLLEGVARVRAPIPVLVREVDWATVVFATAAPEPMASRVSVGRPDERGADLGWLDVTYDFDPDRYLRDVPIHVRGRTGSAWLLPIFGGPPRELATEPAGDGIKFVIPFDDAPAALIVITENAPGTPPRSPEHRSGPAEPPVRNPAASSGVRTAHDGPPIPGAHELDGSPATSSRECPPGRTAALSAQTPPEVEVRAPSASSVVGSPAAVVEGEAAYAEGEGGHPTAWSAAPGASGSPGVSSAPVEGGRQDSSGLLDEGLVLSGEWGMALVPTMDNAWGDFARPGGEMPVLERWELRQGSATVHATYGPHGLYSVDVGAWRPVVYSDTRGIWKDPIHRKVLGPKGHVPEEFLDFGDVRRGQVVRVRTRLTVPVGGGFPAVGGAAAKEMRIDGIPVELEDRGYLALGGAPLGAGEYGLELRFVPDENLRLRAHFAVVPDPEGYRRPEWITVRGPARPGGQVAFTTELPPDASGTLQVATASACRVLVGEVEVGRQGGFDPYAEKQEPRVGRYDLTDLGGEEVTLVLTEGDAPPALLADGPVVTGPGWRAARDGVPVEVMPRRRQNGDPAALHLTRRPHPLPGAAWLEDSAPGAALPIELAMPDAGDQDEWFHVVVPPGASEMKVDLHGELHEVLISDVLLDDAPAEGPAQGLERSVGGGVAADGSERWDGGGEAPHVSGRLEDMRSGRPPGKVTRLEFVQEGASVRVSLPGEAVRRVDFRVRTRAARRGGAAFAGPVRFSVGTGLVELGDWEAVGLAGYSGGVCYRRVVELSGDPSPDVVLDLGRVRGTCEVRVNGAVVGVRICAPYVFGVGPALTAGANELEVVVFGTLAPYLDEVSPTHFVFPGQRTTGLFGPVRLRLR